MIQGVVNPRGELTVVLRLRGAAGMEIEGEAVIDAGFTGPLSLPPAVVGRLGLPFDQTIEWLLADNSPVMLDRYSVEVDWFGDDRPVSVVAVGDVPLVGTRLLAGDQMWAEFAPAAPLLSNPSGNDSPCGHVELVATRGIQFSGTPQSVVFNSGNAGRGVPDGVPPEPSDLSSRTAPVIFSQAVDARPLVG